MPRKTQPEGRPKMHDINTEQKLKNEAFLHSNPPKGTWFFFSRNISIEYKYNNSVFTI